MASGMQCCNWVMQGERRGVLNLQKTELLHVFVLLRYVEEHVQKTGVAIETQGFTFVTSGRKRESLTVLENLMRFTI